MGEKISGDVEQSQKTKRVYLIFAGLIGAQIIYMDIKDKMNRGTNVNNIGLSRMTTLALIIYNFLIMGCVTAK